MQRSTYDLPKTNFLVAEPRINPRYSKACLSCKFVNIPYHWQAPVASILQQLEENDIIRKADPSKPTNVLSSLLIWAKPNSPQEPRVCLDSRIQNLIMIKEATSLVGINEVLAHFSQASMVSQLDLSSAYFSIGLSEKVIPAFAFIHPISKQRYNHFNVQAGTFTIPVAHCEAFLAWEQPKNK